MQKAPNKDKRKDSGKGKDKVCGPMHHNTLLLRLEYKNIGTQSVQELFFW